MIAPSKKFFDMKNPLTGSVKINDTIKIISFTSLLIFS